MSRSRLFTRSKQGNKCSWRGDFPRSGVLARNQALLLTTMTEITCFLKEHRFLAACFHGHGVDGDGMEVLVEIITVVAPHFSVHLFCRIFSVFKLSSEPLPHHHPRRYVSWSYPGSGIPDGIISVWCQAVCLSYVGLGIVGDSVFRSRGSFVGRSQQAKVSTDISRTAANGALPRLMWRRVRKAGGRIP